MPIVSRGIVLDDHIEDEDYILLVGLDGEPLYCVLHEIDPTKNKKKSTVMGAFKKEDEYFIYTRTSNIGTTGRINEKKYPSDKKCIEEFTKKFKKLTENTWPGRKDFQIRNGVVLFSTGEKVDESSEEDTTSEPISIDPSVQYLVDLIGSGKSIIDTLHELNIDTKKSGKCDREKGLFIPPENITRARVLLYKYYIDMSEGLQTNAEDVSAVYYSLIPVISKKIKLISTLEEISEKLTDLDTLENISFTISIVSKEQKIAKSPGSEMVALYRSLGYNIKELSSGREHHMIRQYFYNSKGSHHFKMDIDRIYTLENPVKETSFLENYGSERRELLYHGSRLVNWVSILSKGLLINPSSVCDKVTGKMFGNGIYWANSASKSGQYCTSSYGRSEKCVLALADVALGREHRKIGLSGPPDFTRYDTAWGVGRNSYKSYSELLPGLYIPEGKLCDSGVPGTNLFYDEKVIYSADRYLFRYLIVVNMN